MTDETDPNREYVERRIRKATGINALKRIRRLVDDLERADDVNRRAARYIVALMVVLIAGGLLALWLVQSARP